MNEIYKIIFLLINILLGIIIFFEIRKYNPLFFNVHSVTVTSPAVTVTYSLMSGTSSFIPSIFFKPARLILHNVPSGNTVDLAILYIVSLPSYS